MEIHCESVNSFQLAQDPCIRTCKKQCLKFRVYCIRAGTDVFVSNVFTSASARVSSSQRNGTFHTETYFAFNYAVP